MNFKQLLFLALFIGASSCGVKGPPKPPPGTSIPGYVKNFKADPKASQKDAENKSDKDKKDKANGPGSGNGK